MEKTIFTRASFKGLIIALFLLAAQPTGGQIINTIAGTGYPGYSGDGGPATAAQIDGATVVTFDNTGNIYFPDYNNNVIRKISTTGIITTVVGNGSAGFSGDGGPATAAELFKPSFVTIVGGNMYIADYFNHVIRMVNSSGIISTIAGSGGYGGFSGDGGAATSANLYFPTSVAFDVSNNMYIADEANDRIRKVTASGIISTLAGGGYSSSSGVAATSCSLRRPGGVTVDGSGNVLFTDVDDARICKVDAHGILSIFAGTGSAGYGGDGGPATAARLNHPLRLVMDTSGALYFGDQVNNRTRKISPSGIITTIAGNGTAGFSGDGGAPTSAELYGPQGVGRDALGDIYIVDASNDRIRKITSCHASLFDISGPSTVCVGSQVTLTNYSGGGTWTSSTPGVATIDNYGVVTGVSAGTTTITYAISNACGSLSTTLYLNVFTPPHSGIITGARAVCPGTSLALTDTTYGGFWRSGDTTVAGVNPATGLVTAFAGGTTNIYYLVNNSCATDTARATITVNPLPNAGILSGTDSVCTGDTATLHSTQSGGVWSSSNNSLVSVNATTGFVSGLHAGLVHMSYIVTNACGSDTSRFDIYPKYHCTESVNSVELGQPAVQVSPNPVNGVATITLVGFVGEKSIAVTDIAGKLMLLKNETLNTFNLDMSQYAAGIYLLRVNAGGRDYTEKVIVQ